MSDHLKLELKGRRHRRKRNDKVEVHRMPLTVKRTLAPRFRSRRRQEITPHRDAVMRRPKRKIAKSAKANQQRSRHFAVPGRVWQRRLELHIGLAGPTGVSSVAKRRSI